MRISIIGLPGSGKSTLARTLSARFGMPHIHLDRFWFAAGGLALKKGDLAERDRIRASVRACVEQAIAQEAWVSDGFYRHVQPDIAGRADVLIYLAPPFLVRLWNHLVRTFRRHDRHSELSMLHDLLFVGELVTRTFRTGPKIRRFIAQYPEKLVVLRSRKEVEGYLSSL